MEQVYVRAAISLAMAAVLAGGAEAQTLTASVRGQVRDAQEAPVRNATVTVRAEAIGLVRDDLAEVDEGATRLGQGKHGVRRAAAAPPIADSQTARILDDRVARCSCHGPGQAGAAEAAAIGRTSALATVRRTPGANPNTAVGVPAAAQTIG